MTRNSSAGGVTLAGLCLLAGFLCSGGQARDDSQSSRKPLTETEVIKLLKGHVATSRVEDLAREHGISFDITSRTEDELREAGATTGLVATLREISHHTPSAEGTRSKSSERRTGGVREPSSDKVIQYIREKFGVPSTTAMILDPFHNSPDPEFLDTIVSVDDGRKTSTSKKSSEISVSKDGHFLVMGFLAAGGPAPSSFVPLGSGGVDDIPRGVQEAFKLAPSIAVSRGTIRTTQFPSFFVTTVTADNAGKKSTLDAYVTSDHKFLVLGNIYDLSIDPRTKALRTLILQNQPETGPKNAPVTIVEFADLECPTCAHAHEYLEKTILPMYKDKVRVIFKEFPLQYHEFAMPAAIADQCGYRINPALYLPYRTLIFQHQGEFEAIKANQSAVRDLLLNIGQQVGIDKMELAGCMDSKASLPPIQADMKEAAALDVNSTPTFFINGRTMVGAEPESFTKLVEEGLQDPKKKK